MRGLLLLGMHRLGVLLLLCLHLVRLLLTLLLCFLDRPLFGGRCFSVHILDLVLKLLDLCDEAVLVLLL